MEYLTALGKGISPSTPLNGCEINVSVNFKPDHTPQATAEDLHILVAPGVEFSLLCLARGSARGVLNQSKS